ncbi:hypothetical protein M878_02590 [Streptomyces roseochromogenus subsp. oscitans DS 12.976]|uniref:Uncharacterized protein n=1 Tax=Streptomyces roseochromogenus subsp. oscitans DS 12.976 TaxID=1352936 RepID=V6L4Y7_STRRC|nr:hypothetical protein M878_02590 [Streptomyces roseochromogenus subsp. oscitans DS 12.976]
MVADAQRRGDVAQHRAAVVEAARRPTEPKSTGE